MTFIDTHSNHLSAASPKDWQSGEGLSMHETARKLAKVARKLSPNRSAGVVSPASDGLGARWRRVLADRYAGAHRVKRLARDFEVSTATAKSWLAGSAPRAEALERAAQLFGLAAVAEVLGADTAPAARQDRLETDIAKLGDQLADLAAELGELGRRGP